MASKITSRSTPFSLATASTTINSSLLIRSWLPRPPVRPLKICSGLACLAGAPGGFRRQAEYDQVRHAACLLDRVECNVGFGAVDVEHDGRAFDAHDAALETPPSIL